MAKRVLTDEEFNQWLIEHELAKMAKDGRERLLYESYCRLERELSLLGATGIEDKLQDLGNHRDLQLHFISLYHVCLFNFNSPRDNKLAAQGGHRRVGAHRR